MHTGDPLLHIMQRLRATRRRMLFSAVFAAAWWTLGIWCVLFLLAAVIEAVLHLSVTGRTSLDIVIVCIALVAAAALKGRAFLRAIGVLHRPSEDDIARMVGAKFPAIRDGLLNAMQLQREHSAASGVGYSLDLVRAAFASVVAATESINFDDAIDREPHRRAMRWMAPTSVVALALLIGVPDLRNADLRLLNFRTSYEPPPPFTFEISPGNTRRIRGDSVLITVRTVGNEIQREIVLQTRESDQQFPRQTMLRSDNGTFTFVIDALKRSTEYFAQAKGIESDKYTVAVTDRPEVRSLSVQLTFPSYTHAPAIALEDNAGDLVGLAGAEAHFTITANKPLAFASIVFTPDSSVADSAGHRAAYAGGETVLQTSAEKAHGTFIVRRSGSYTIKLVDTEGNGSADGIVYRVTALRDESPTIHVVHPQAVTDITETSKIGILSRIHDDFGFSRMALHYRLSQSKFARPWDEFKETAVPFSGEGKTDLEVPYIWDLRPFGLVPEDAVEFYLEIFDNDIVNGPKSARSEILTLRLPSLEAALHESSATQADAAQNLQEAERAAEELKQQMEQTTRELRQQSQEQKLSWQEQKKIQDILKKQEQLQNKVAEAQQQLEEAVQKLESKQAISPGTLQKYIELQKLFQELKNPELMQAMKRLQDAMEKLSPEQMRQAMKNFTMNEEQFRQNIERTMEMLKRIQAEQKVDELMKRAEQLEKDQQQLQEQTQNAQSKEDRDKLAAQQKDLAQRAKDMQKEFADLQKKMNEMGKDSPKDEMNKASQELQQDQPEQEMQDASQDMSGDPQSAQEHQKKARKGMQNFKKNMAGVKKKMQENQQKQQMTEMRRALQDLLELSKREEGIKQETDQSAPNSASMPEIAKKQAGAQGDLGNVVNRMMKLAQKSFAVTPEMGKQLGTALREMQNATGNLEQRQPPQASQNEGNAIGAMNKAAMAMQEALQQMGKGEQQGSGGGMQSFMQQLNKMAGEQEQINGMTQKLGNQGSMSMQQQAEMQRLAGQQQAVKQSLEELRRQQDQLTGGKKNTLGDLNKIAEEMQEVINEMRSGNIKPETIQRQEKILSRLLDAQRSTHERDFDKKREGKSGQAAGDRQSPAALPDMTKSRSIEEQLRLQEAGYSKDYERRIKRYFESLRGAPPK